MTWLTIGDLKPSYRGLLFILIVGMLSANQAMAQTQRLESTDGETDTDLGDKGDSNNQSNSGDLSIHGKAVPPCYVSPITFEDSMDMDLGSIYVEFVFDQFAEFGVLEDWNSGDQIAIEGSDGGNLTYEAYCPNCGDRPRYSATLLGLETEDINVILSTSSPALGNSFDSASACYLIKPLTDAELKKDNVYGVNGLAPDCPKLNHLSDPLLAWGMIGTWTSGDGAIATSETTTSNIGQPTHVSQNEFADKVRVSPSDGGLSNQAQTSSAELTAGFAAGGGCGGMISPGSKHAPWILGLLLIGFVLLQQRRTHELVRNR